MSIFSAAKPPSDLRQIPAIRAEVRRQSLKKPITLMMKDTSSDVQKKEAPIVPPLKIHSDSARSDLRFDRLQPSDDDSNYGHRYIFGNFIAREALLDEEYWTAAWLRAESHWEDRSDARHVDSFKRQFADQEFMALKRRCNKQHPEKCTCIIVVKKEERNVKRTILSSVVGTLDVSIRHLMYGETFPEERVRSPFLSCIHRTDQPRYGYVANLCVSKHARRQRIAWNMLHLAVEVAESYGVEQIYMHVKKDNKAARKLYDKIGFEAVNMALPCSSEEESCLLCLETLAFTSADCSHVV